MVARHHGHDVDIAGLRSRHAISAKGSGLAQLIDIAGHLQLAARPVRAEPAALARLACPAILHWDMNHFVELVSVGRSGALIHDPARGRRRVTGEELTRHFPGEAEELTPTHEFTPLCDRRRSPLRALLGKPVSLKRAWLQVLTLALVL